MKPDRKNIIKKLFQDKLTEEEKSELFFSPPVTGQMLKQWEEAASGEETVSDGKIWNHIRKRTITKHTINSRYSSFYKTYSIVASFLLLIAAGGSLYHHSSEKTVHIYTVSTGVRSIDSIILPDGSKVQLGPNSKLVYPENFGTNDRNVKLTGQAFFYVTKDKAHPFVVQSPQMNVTALGTAFEVFNYENTGITETILLEGKVKISLTNAPDQEAVILVPNQKMAFDKKSNNTVIEEINANQYTLWREKGILSFENEKISMIIPRLEQWYNEKILFTDAIGEYRFTFKVKDESLDRILYMISSSSKIKYKKTDTHCELYMK